MPKIKPTESINRHSLIVRYIKSQVATRELHPSWSAIIYAQAMKNPYLMSKEDRVNGCCDFDPKVFASIRVEAAIQKGHDRLLQGSSEAVETFQISLQLPDRAKFSNACLEPAVPENLCPPRLF